MVDSALGDDDGSLRSRAGSADSPVSVRECLDGGCKPRSGGGVSGSSMAGPEANNDDERDDDSSWAVSRSVGSSTCSFFNDDSRELKTAPTGEDAADAAFLDSMADDGGGGGGPSTSSTLRAVHVLLTCPRTRRFELILVGYNTDDQPTVETLLALALERCKDDGDGDGDEGECRTSLVDTALYSGEMCRPDPGAEVMTPSRPLSAYGVKGETGDDVLVAIPAGMSSFEAIELATPILMEHWGALLGRSRRLSDSGDGGDADNRHGNVNGRGVTAALLMKKASSLVSEAAAPLSRVVPVAADKTAKGRTSFTKTLRRNGDEISLTPSRSVLWRGMKELVIDMVTAADRAEDGAIAPRPLRTWTDDEPEDRPWQPPHPKMSPQPPILKRAIPDPGLCGKNVSTKAAANSWATAMSSFSSRVSNGGVGDSEPAASSNTHSKQNKKDRSRKKIRFGTITIREYPMVLGDHPNVSYGPPVTLGWDYDEYEPLSMDLYERCHPSRSSLRRDMRQMMMNYYRRKNVLSFWAGYTEEEVKAATRSVKRDKLRRKVTANFMPVMRCYETALSVKAAMRRGSAKKKGAEYYEARVLAEASRKRQ